MRVLRAEADPERFFGRLRRAPSRVLLLDYDGTLAPFREERDRAVPYPEVREQVRRILMGGRTRLVVISGRAIETLRPLLGIEPPPELWGTHGWERLLAGGAVERIELPSSVRDALDDARARLPLPEAAERVEVKPASLAVHVRGLGEEEGRRLMDAARDAWAPWVEGGTLEAHAFDGGLELRPPGRHKGSAVEDTLATEPRDAAAAYLGDDLTDEDAFEALRGRGLSVLVRDELRRTAADVWLRPPGDLLDFLRRWERESGPTE